jgi:hypothetical protein
MRPSAIGPAETIRRVRPGDAAWPSEASWDGLRQAVGGRLIQVESPLTACRMAPVTLFDDRENGFGARASARTGDRIRETMQPYGGFVIVVEP